MEVQSQQVILKNQEMTSNSEDSKLYTTDQQQGLDAPLVVRVIGYKNEIYDSSNDDKKIALSFVLLGIAVVVGVVLIVVF